MSKKTDWTFFFWLVGLLLGLGLVYLMVQANVFASEGKLQEASYLITACTAFIVMFLISLAFVIMVEIGVVKSDIKPIPKSNVVASWGIILGLFFWSVLTFIISPTSLKSIVQVPLSSVFQQASVVLPEFWSVFIVAVSAPLAEEVTFLVGVPLVLFTVFLALSKQLKLGFLNNVWFKIIMTAIITSLIFALFHIANDALTAFLISAIVFRIFLIGTVYADQFKNLIPLADLTVFFAIGCHVANNILSTVGFARFFELMITGGEVGLFALITGWFVLAFFGLAFLIAGLDLKKRVFS